MTEENKDFNLTSEENKKEVEKTLSMSDNLEGDDLATRKEEAVQPEVEAFHQPEETPSDSPLNNPDQEQLDAQHQAELAAQEAQRAQQLHQEAERKAREAQEHAAEVQRQAQLRADRVQPQDDTNNGGGSNGGGFDGGNGNGPHDNGGNNHSDDSKKGNGVIWKTAVVAAVAGMLGGGATYGISEAINGNNNSNLTVANTKGSAKVANVTVSTSTDTTKAFETIEKAVVSVINLQKQSTSLFGESDSSDDSSSSSDSSASGDLTEYSEGSGVIYKKADGTAYIVTNNHVVSGSDKVEVILADGTKLTAKLVGTDEISDLAVLSIDSAKVTTVAEFADSDDIKVGAPAIAIGSPLGSEYATSVTQGIVSATNRNVDVTTDNYGTVNTTVIQTDAAINPGNSGGPLVNTSGQIIGINSMKLASTEVEGMGFAIPSNEVVNIINQLVANGQVDRPAIGASILDLSNVSTQQQSSVLKLPTTVTSGVVLASVNSGSPAANAGLKKYDVVTKIDDTEITGSTDLRKVLYNHKVGDKIEVTYYREGKKATVTMTLSQTLTESTKSTKN